MEFEIGLILLCVGSLVYDWKKKNSTGFENLIGRLLGIITMILGLITMTVNLGIWN